ncbi:hypothetical protein BDS110ZK17_41150 [Bradyrhizobium diazoefficiens]|nr:hypothetical protein XF16B_85800 [Bradyrhizobium diazoefficiens]BCF74251.1 hypothetical protein XF19B_86040 [Bradyrhizobium diazoefficiens]
MLSSSANANKAAIFDVSSAYGADQLVHATSLGARESRGSSDMGKSLRNSLFLARRLIHLALWSFWNGLRGPGL